MLTFPIKIGILALLLQLLATASRCAVPDSLTMEIDRLLARYDNQSSPGLTIGIIRDGQLIFQKGYGMADLQKQLRNDPQTVFKIASLSKQFTAAAVMNLVRERRLSLDDDIRQYVKGFPDYGKPVTVRHLLYHTSGIRDYMVLMWLCGIDFGQPFTNEDAMAVINRQSALHFTTGHRCVYSNSNYILLAEIVRQVTGVPFAEYAEKTIFRKLDMDNTGFGNRKKPVAISYGKDLAAYAPYSNDNTTMGDGGMFTTLGDLAKWDRSFYDSTSLAYPILQRGRLENGNLLTYGMGIMTGQYRSDAIQSHSGAFLGYRSEMLRFPQKRVTIICLANTEEINPEAVTRQIADIYIFKNPAPLPPVTSTPIRHEAYTGKYAVAPQVFVDITWRNGELSGKVTGQPAQILYPDSANTFRIGQTGDMAVFSQENAGQMQQLTVRQRQGNTVARRAGLVSGELMRQYEGTYFCSEQNATYRFFIENNGLWFTVGAAPKVKADIVQQQQKLWFDYKGLESATMEFSADSAGNISGFTLSSGRVSGLQFIRR